jgi:hypothetical protein
MERETNRMALVRPVLWAAFRQILRCLMKGLTELGSYR